MSTLSLQSGLEEPLPPDIMNDPEYATNTKDGEDGEPDYCRICRSEGTPTEPLFYPCKCSGSIKHVHQECLMLWLSHSQKKYCELCKTPFRFTKLYSPNMPKTIPAKVLARHLGSHSLQYLKTWLRLCLVIFVWLVCLPYAIRHVWSLLFWFSDGGWPLGSIIDMRAQNVTKSQGIDSLREVLLAKLAGNGTSPASPLLAVQTTPASMGGKLGQLAVVSRLTDPLVAGLTRYTNSGSLDGVQATSAPNILLSGGGTAGRIRPSTLLSDVAFLSNMTRHSQVNQLILTIAEGYIITILVVVSFILVFLIREWVVQQQPGINVGAGFNARIRDEDRPREEPIVAAPLVIAPQAIEIGQDLEQVNHGANRPAAVERRGDLLPHNREPGAVNAFQIPEETADDMAGAQVADANIHVEEAVPEPPGNDGPIQIRDQDGAVRIVQNWEVEFERHPVHDFDSDDEDHHQEMPEPHNADEEIYLNIVGDPAPEIAVPPRSIVDRVADWFWGDVGQDMQQDEQGANDEQIVMDMAAEAPFVPVANAGLHDLEDADDVLDQDPEVAAAARAAGIDPNDPDAIDDAEDFEGIMELVGMRGPFFNLIQNSLFSAFLLSLTVAFGIWIPYNIGRIALLLIAHPGPALKLPLRFVYGCAVLLQDLALSMIGFFSYFALAIVTALLRLVGFSTTQAPAYKFASLGLTAWQTSVRTMVRIEDGIVEGLCQFLDPELFVFSAASHESLLSIKALCAETLANTGKLIAYPFVEGITFAGIHGTATSVLKSALHEVSNWPALLAKPDSWVISLEVGKRSTPLDLGLSVWNGWDRFWATFAGYSALSVLGVLYVRKGSPFSTSDVGKEWEASIVDLLNQAGGVMKVILIISIEMLAFPLYCGLLLDVALLPLFANATIASRIAFTGTNPLTSIFVHWFVGTCYMFHFALFVSMCRKIMRKGVLYFIRDPDDPTFHPVRDVLERNITTQLRKILFSALIYGALVIICLGGVVWGLAYTFKGVLPIHWSSNEPVLEFPVDLLFYNFLMPLAVRFFKPSDGLHSMYSWWFRKCARMLRLTWFLFGERQRDEEGHSLYHEWIDFFKGVRANPAEKRTAENGSRPLDQDPGLRAYFQHDGKYVRAPASDQVRVPKGVGVFLEVDEMNNRIDGEKDKPDDVRRLDSNMYTQVYIPPWFRFRVCLFIFYIWLFAAITGVSTTLIPLVFGRKIFAMIIPKHVRKNDVYAFSIGIYILGTALYALLHLRKFLASLPTVLSINSATPRNILRRLQSIGSHIARIAITYAAFLLVLPALFAFFVEFYFIVPLHTYFAIREEHVMHLVQSWTLGLLYVKLTMRIILWYETSRPAQSIRAITRNGYLDPDARLAMRSFVIPATLILGTALFAPWAWARILVRFFLSERPETHYLIYRFAYPLALGLVANGVVAWKIVELLKSWRLRVRDEVYLIGERLHNFGERKNVSAGLGVPRARRVTT